jgi:hypothetical protein
MNERTVALDDIVAQGKGSIVSDMGGEKVMLSVRNGKYYGLGDIGGKIWDMMERPIAARQLVDSLLAEYEVERGECEHHVLAFLELLAQEGLLEAEAGAGAGAEAHGLGR